MRNPFQQPEIITRIQVIISLAIIEIEKFRDSRLVRQTRRLEIRNYINYLIEVVCLRVRTIRFRLNPGFCQELCQVYRLFCRLVNRETLTPDHAQFPVFLTESKLQNIEKPVGINEEQGYDLFCGFARPVPERIVQLADIEILDTTEFGFKEVDLLRALEPRINFNLYTIDFGRVMTPGNRHRKFFGTLSSSNGQVQFFLVGEGLEQGDKIRKIDSL